MIYLLPLVSFVLYLYYVGLDKSISSTYYSLPRNQRWMFTMALWAYSLGALIYFQTTLMVVASFLIMIVGASPGFKKKLEEKVHLFGAIGGIFFALLSVWVEYGHWYLSILSIFGIFLIRKRKDFAYWAEVIVIGAVTLTWLGSYL